MTNTEISNSVSILTAPVVGESYNIAKELAADILKGCTDDYLFFYNGHGVLSATQSFDQYILLTADSVSRNGNSFESDSVLVSQIYVVSESVLVSDDLSFSGSTLELDSSPISSFSGSGSVSSVSQQYKTSIFTYSREHVSVTSFVDNVIYSSLPSYPHLIEGVENYAFLGVCLFVAVCVFKLSDRIFRRVY